MHSLINDDQLAKIASDNQVEPLAHRLGIKLADAQEMLMGVVQQGYFDTLAKFGHVPQNEDEAIKMLEVGMTLQQHKHASEGAHSSEMFDKIAGSLGMSQQQAAPEAANIDAMLLRDGAEKTAAYLDEEQVATHLLSQIEANNL